MAEVNFGKLVKLVKDDEMTQAEAARQLGVTTGQLSMMQYCLAQVEAGVYKKMPGTAASVKKARDNEGNRWELVAARAGISVKAAKELYEEAGGNASKSYVGRGRDFTGATGSKTATRTSGDGKKSTNGRKAKATTAGSKTAASKKTATRRGARTRAERQAASSRNPS
jgi:hypothetical protein